MAHEGLRPTVKRPSMSSDNAQEIDAAEEAALLTGERQSRSLSSFHNKHSKWRDVALFIWAVLATAGVIVFAAVYQRSIRDGADAGSDPKGKRNLIFMVSDGMGPTSLSLTRSYQQISDNLPFGAQLVLDKHLIGQSRTRSTSSLVTDSAAGATAFSCGKKSYNGAIAVLDDHSACGTVLEAAKKAGYMTGLVVTTRITDATPATFAAHVNMRSEEDLIAEQMVGGGPLGRVVDLMLGGGRCHFLSNSTTGSCREDDRDIVQLAEKRGWKYLDSRKQFDNIDPDDAAQLPLLGLFADTDFPYEVDRRNQTDVYPSLDEMARKAMRLLSSATKGRDKGFFLMIEGSRIDHAGHANDPVAQVHEVLAYDEAFASVLQFLDDDDTLGVMVSTSDHETGGLSVARQLHATYPDYLWYPGVLTNASHSAEFLAGQYAAHRTHSPDENMQEFLRQQVKTGLGIGDPGDDEIQLLVDQPLLAAYTYADMVSRRAQTGWATHGHSGADVNIYSSDPRVARALVGNHENTEVGKFLSDYLDVDVDAITKELKKKGAVQSTNYTTGQSNSWLGPLPVQGQRLDGQDHMNHYEGDFKHRRRQVGGCDCGH